MSAKFSNWPRRVFKSLASRIGFFVFVATLASALAVAGTSALAVRQFLQTQTENRIPEAASRAGERLHLWYAQRLLDVDVFAHSDIVVDGLARVVRGGGPRRAEDRAEVEQYLRYVREGLPVYAAIFVLDARGRPVARVGSEVALDEATATRLAAVSRPTLSGVLTTGQGEAMQIVSAPVAFPRPGASASLHGLIPIADLQTQLRAAVGDGTGRLHVFDDEGALLASSIDGYAGRLDPAIAGAEQGRVVAYEAVDHVRVVASALQLDELGWRVVFERDYGSTFAAIASILTRTVAMNVGIALVLAGFAFFVARRMLRPLRVLSRCAIRLRDGESDVALPVVSADHEIGTLSRSFTEMVESLTRANEALERLAVTDGLTQIHNHRYFQDQLALEIADVERTGAPLSLVLLDLDDFKKLNDRHGHATGDGVLRELARIVKEKVRPRDVLARYGGEEFALLAPETTLEDAVALAEGIRIAVQEHAFRGSQRGPRILITVSIGVAAYRGDRMRFFADADGALYAAKNAGKDCVEVARD